MAKRPKRAKVKAEKFEQTIYYVQCPHCKTSMKGGINENIDRLFCYHCGEVVMLEWGNVK